MEELRQNTELRHLPLSKRRQLAEILEVRDAWQMLMAHVPGDAEGTLRYSSRHISMVQREAAHNALGRTATEILLDEWGTSGRRRPTLQNLTDLLTELQLYRAADYVSMNLLGGAPVPRNNVNRIPTLTEEFGAVAIAPPAEEVPEKTPLLEVSYEELEKRCGWNFNANGNEVCIGVGAFACVFKAEVPGFDSPVAVKRFHHDNPRAGAQFEAELKAMSELSHDSILRLLGVSQGHHKCLVLEMMEGGNLEDNLACRRRTTPINWRQRLKIGLGAASGLGYIHDLKLVHRDVKSANVLLDEYLTAKLADFGLVQRERGDDEEEPTESQLEIAGTSCYMSPEAITYGRVSRKGDVFSFGVVLLELLTSLPANDPNRTLGSLLLHVEDKCGDNSISALLDTKAGVWGGPGQPVAHRLYNLAVRCLDRRDCERPTMKDVEEALEQLAMND